MREVFRHYGILDTIINDRAPKLISKIWKHLFTMLKVTCNLSSGYHPQVEGQAERTNQMLEQYLRCFISYDQQDDWVDILHFAEFAYNNSIHSSTRQHHSMCIKTIILDGVYLKLSNYPQILVHTIICIDYVRFRQNCLTIYIKPNKHIRTMQIVIDFHPVSILEIEYGYYDGT